VQNNDADGEPQRGRAVDEQVEADAADVHEQRLPADWQLEPEDADDDVVLPLEAEPADVAEQRLAVPFDDEDRDA
jgi:hypothetical protein